MADDLYSRDMVAWAEAQAAALRKRSANEIDWDNVAEEIGDVGGNIVRACESQVINILAHFLKIEFSGLEEPQRHWVREIGSFRIELDRDLTPTIESRMPGRLERLYKYALKDVGYVWAERGEALPDLPPTCPYTWDDVQGRGTDWLPTPGGQTGS
jgi:Domain of unknown function DUF29